MGAGVGEGDSEPEGEADGGAVVTAGVSVTAGLCVSVGWTPAPDCVGGGVTFACEPAEEQAAQQNRNSKTEIIDKTLRKNPTFSPAHAINDNV